MRRVDAGGRVAALRTERDALRTDRERLLRFLVSRPGAVAEDIDARLLPVEELDVGRLLEALAARSEPLDTGAVEELLTGPAPRAEGSDDRVRSVAEAVDDGMAARDLAAAAYEAAALHHLGEAGGADAEYGLHALRRAAGLSRRDAANFAVLARCGADLAAEFEEPGDVPARNSLEYRLYLCRPEIVRQALPSRSRGMAPAELLRLVARQLGMVGVGVAHLLASARGYTGRAGAPKLALPAEPCLETLDALLAVARGWLAPADSPAASPAASPDDKDVAATGRSSAFPLTDYEDAWDAARDALQEQVRDVMRKVGMLEAGAEPPLPHPLTAQLAGTLLSAVLELDPTAEDDGGQVDDGEGEEGVEDGDDEDEEGEDEEDEEEEELQPAAQAGLEISEGLPPERGAKPAPERPDDGLEAVISGLAPGSRGAAGCFAWDAARVWPWASGVCTDGLGMSAASQLAAIVAVLLQEWTASADPTGASARLSHRSHRC